MTYPYDNVAVDDMFDAFVKKGTFSKNVIGKELCGKKPKKSCFSPEIATEVNRWHVRTNERRYLRSQFTFRKVDIV